MQKALIVSLSLLVCGLGLAQDSTPIAEQPPAPVAVETPVPKVAVAEAPPAPKPSVLDSQVQPFFETAPKVQVDLKATYYDFEDGSIVEYSPTFKLQLDEALQLEISLPIYNDSNSYFDPEQLAWELSNGVYGVSGAGVGDIDLFASYNLVKSKNRFLCSDLCWLDVGAGAQVPLDGSYSSGDVVWHLDAAAGASWGKHSLTQSFRYSFVDSYVYVPAMGGFVDGNVYQGVTRFSYQAYERLAIGLNLTQYSANGTNLVLFGPALQCKLFTGTRLFGEVGVPLTGDMPNGDLHMAASAGLELEF